MKEQKVGKVVLIQPERLNFLHMLAKNPNYFGNIPDSKLKLQKKLVVQKTYEQLTCVGYNPDTGVMQATFAINRSTGYGGNLCQTGSLEYVRFYIDFNDGAGFIDQGSTAINVHNIPASNDCKGKSIFPITYVASLTKKTVKKSYCDSPALPKLRAILSWNNEPPVNSPNWVPVWGNVMDSDIQIKPSIKFDFLKDVDLSEFLSLASSSPDLSAKHLAEISGIEINNLLPPPGPPPYPEMVKAYNQLKIPPLRYAYKATMNMIKYPTSELTMLNKSLLDSYKIDYSSIIDKLTLVIPIDKTKANVDYEELECVGLDYNTESLVATVKIKKKAGYSGSLCDAGSKEYVAFWVDWDNSCDWEYVNTVQFKVHDVDMPGDFLSYSVSLPLDATFHRKLCENPNVIRVRGVLAWNKTPSVTNPDQLEFYGNRVDTHVQIKPGVELLPGDVMPLFVVIGGIDVDHVNDATGLTKENSIFAYNALPVPENAAFGGVIVVNGPSFPGHRYRIKVTNLTNGTSYYLSNALSTVGWSPIPPYAPWTTQSPDAMGYYNYLPVNKNILNVLARFNPGTEDKLHVEIEVEGILGTFGKTIQMDNTYPVINLKIDDNGDCTHYKKGDNITGHFYVNDLNIWSWSFGSTYGGAVSGTTNTPAMPGTAFSVPTNAGSNPCGSFSLSAVDKTIVNSQSLGHHVKTSYNVCLK